MLAALIEKEIRLLRRDPQGLAALFIMPAIFILIMSLALRDVFAPPLRDGLTMEIDNADGSVEARRLIEVLNATAGWKIVEVEAGSDDAIRLMIPNGFSEQLFVDPAEQPRQILELSIPADTPPQVLLSIRGRLDAGIQQVQGRYLTKVMEDEGNIDPRPYEYSMDPRNWRIKEQHRYADAGESERDTSLSPSSVQHNTPAWIVFAMFFVLLPLSSGFIVERQEGAFQRLQSLAIPTLSLVLARFAPYYAINMLQMIVMLLIGRWLVPALGGDALALDCSWFGLWVIGSATSMAAIGFSLLLSSLTQTTVQATTMGGIANLLFGALGGIMVPKMIMPPELGSLTVVSPMSWALEGFLDILLRRGSWQDTLPESAALILFSLICTAAAAALLARRAKRNP